MPFKKKEGNEFFQNLNGLKGYYSRIVANVNSTPAQQLKAIAWITYLCAETDEAKRIALLSLYTICKRELGFKFSPDINDNGDEIIADSNEVLAFLTGGAK